MMFSCLLLGSRLFYKGKGFFARKASTRIFPPLVGGARGGGYGDGISHSLFSLSLLTKELL
jgi:hypothetical protein